MISEEHLASSRNTIRRGLLEVSILALLTQGEAYTGDLVSSLKDRGIVVIEGAVYPVLSRLRKYGYLSYRWEESTQGPPRKYFALTSTGWEYYERVRGLWTEMVGVVDALLGEAQGRSAGV